jgi:ribosomal protein S18 acetylase RimI-like enzyme
MVARSRGLTEEERIPLMVLEAVAFDAPDDADGVRALGRDDDDLHLDLVVEGFEAPAEVFAAFRGGRLLRSDCVRAYVVEADGRPVATALSMTIGDHVGVFDVATAPAYRGRGYGRALTARAVADGFEAGARTALLQSSEAGLSVYERLGFRTVEHWTAWVSEPAR